MSGHGPVEAAVEQQMREIGAAIGRATPPGYGFALLMFRLDADDGRMNYISNASRDDMVAALKELLANFEGRLAPPARG